MNTIIDRLQRSLELFKRSSLVIRDHPKLLAFPALTGVLTTAIALFFLVPVLLAGVIPHWVAGSPLSSVPQALGFIQHHDGTTVSFQASPVGLLVLAAIYLYASEGRVPDAYDGSMMGLAWKTKKARG